MSRMFDNRCVLEIPGRSASCAGLTLEDAELAVQSRLWTADCDASK